MSNALFAARRVAPRAKHNHVLKTRAGILAAVAKAQHGVGNNECQLDDRRIEMSNTPRKTPLKPTGCILAPPGRRRRGARATSHHGAGYFHPRLDTLRWPAPTLHVRDSRAAMNLLALTSIPRPPSRQTLHR